MQNQIFRMKNGMNSYKFSEYRISQKHYGSILEYDGKSTISVALYVFLLFYLILEHSVMRMHLISNILEKLQKNGIHSFLSGVIIGNVF